MSKKFDLADWKARRQRCRTDLRYLCGVLGYRDVGKPHRAMIEHCQKFKGGTEPLNQVRIKDGAGYTPLIPMWNLEGPRKRMALVTRNGLKTSILTQAHSIQWIINYPDVRILLVSAQLGRAKDFLKGVKEHFTKNEIFRWLFPEYCPKNTEAGKIEDFGNDEQFTVPCRRTPGIKEPTVRLASADSSVAGGHYDVIKVDDAVEDQNTRTPGGIEQTKKFFGALFPLLQPVDIAPGHAWLDVAGTIYHFSDLHQETIYEEQKKKLEKREWQILVISACTDWELCSAAFDEWEQANDAGETDKAAECAAKLAALEKANVWWPRLGVKYLKGIERDKRFGPMVLFPQYLMRPLQDKNGLIKHEDDIKWISRAELNNLKPRINWNVTVDLAGMGTSQGLDADYDCINLHGWGTDGRCYFDRIIWGRLDPDTVIDHMFKLFAYEPRIMFFKIEAEAHARVLAPFLEKAMAQRKVYLPIMEIQRDNTVSKVHRIRGTQPYWKNGAFRFCADIEFDAREQLKLEAKYFPKFNHDDILDTIADSLQSRDGIVSDVQGREKMTPVPVESDYREWKGIPVAALSWEMLQGMTEEEYEGGLSHEFNPSASMFNA